MNLFLGAMALSLGLSISAEAAAAETCRNLPQSRLTVLMIHADLDLHPVDLVQLGKMRAEADNQVGTFKDPVSVMQGLAEFTIHVAGDKRTVELGSPTAICAAPEEVIVRLGFPKRRLFVMQGIEQSPCLREALISHETKHIEFDKMLLADFVERTRPHFHEALGRIKAGPVSPSHRAAVEQFQASLRDFLLTAQKTFLDIREVQQANLDTAHEIAALRSACGGRLQELERELSRAGRAT